LSSPAVAALQTIDGDNKVTRAIVAKGQGLPHQPARQKTRLRGRTASIHRTRRESIAQSDGSMAWKDGNWE